MSNGTPASPGFLDLSGINALNAQRDALKEQMLRARALGQPSGRQYGTWGGALAGGLGDLFGTIAGNVKEGQLAKALAANQEAEQGKLGEFNTALGAAANNPDAMERLAFQAISSGHPALTKTGTAALELQGNKLRRAMEAQRAKTDEENKQIDNARQERMAESLDVWRKYIMANPAIAGAVGQGAGGPQLFTYPTRAPAGAPPGTVPTATPMQTPEGAPVIKPNELSTADKEALQGAASDVASLSQLSGTFKPEFVGGGALAGKANEVIDSLAGGGGVAGDVLGAMTGRGAEGIKERADWWRKYNALINLPERNKIFGASLSAGEKASWDSAQSVARGSDPAKAQEALAWLAAKASEKLAGLRESTLAEGASPVAVQALTRAAAPPSLPTSTPVREPTRARAKPPTAAEDIIEYKGKRYRRGPNGEPIPL